MKSSEVAPMTLGTVTEYMCCKYHGYVPILSSFMTYHQVCNKNNTTGATSAEWTANPSGFTPDLKSYVYCFVLFFPSIFSPHWSYILFIERRVSWWPSWLEVGITGHKFGRGPSKDHSTKDWLQLAQWFLRRRFLCEYTIGSYVKLSSAVGVILVQGPNRRTHFWRRTIQWLFHQNFVLIEQMVSDKKIFMGISHRVLC